MRDSDDVNSDEQINGATYAVGYRRPPVHTRFKPGQSGNPSGRVKGSKNLKSLFHKILNEEISLQDGSDTRKVSKAEAIMRRLIIGALKGDSRSLMTLMRIPEQTGEFGGPAAPLKRIEGVIARWEPSDDDGTLPAITQTNRE